MNYPVIDAKEQSWSGFLNRFIMTAKEKIKGLKQSRFMMNRFLFRFIRQGWWWSLFFTDGSYRSGILTRIRFGRYYHQQVTFTASNRYPLLFRACADYLASVKSQRILSFGCSTGEEVFSIGDYIPDAKIMGTEINRWELKQCRKVKIIIRFLSSPD